MAIIAQKQLFGWNEIEGLGDLERLRLVAEHMPDEELMRALESRRARGRDDYPVRAVWNSILAGVVFGHESVESLRRELLRNAQLRQVCGFEVTRGAAAVPSRFAYTRFLRSLMDHDDMIEGIFASLVEELSGLLDGFGVRLACDGKAVRSHGRRRRTGAASEADGRRDLDADVGVKRYRGIREDGSVWEKITKWFGYKLHLVVDSHWELPVAFEVTKASAGEQPVAHRLLDALDVRHPALLERCEYFSADKGYDTGSLSRRLWDTHQVRPVIDIRNLWDKDEPSRPLGDSLDLVHDHRGAVYCCCPRTGRQRPMVYGGFEADRETLKYLCPARHHKRPCPGANDCSVGHSVRVPISPDKRTFPPLPRATMSWQREYSRRTAVERVNSRLDVSFGLERHYIRGLAKMRLRCGLALIVMLAMALGRVRHNQHERLRSLVQAA